MVSEYTPLTSEPEYAFKTKYLIFKRRIRDAKCCLSAVFFALLVLILVVTISLSLNHYSSAVDYGKEVLNTRDEFESKMQVLQTSSPSYRHQMSTATSETADQIGRNGYVMYHATKWLAKKLNHNSTNSFEPICPNILQNSNICQKKPKPKCSPTRYRSIDGSCNHLLHPNMGVSYSKFSRLVPPVYEDSIGEPRGGKDSSYLPSASLVSKLVHRPEYRNDPNFTVMLAIWGQFIDHDITATALSRGQHGEAISCCDQEQMHPECFPVLEKLEDGTTKCMDFVRSAPVDSCCFAPREQFNQVTPFLDGSVIYGSDSKLAANLRTFTKGQLKMLTSGPVGKYLLPISTNPKDGCNRLEQSKHNRYCFISGDNRANENLFLTTMHLIWARQHNRIANMLGDINPNWNDEQIYQETKHIIAAQLQHITYNEFLPIILGKEEQNILDLVKEGYYYDYNSTLKPEIINSFAAAAFRFAHTLIPGMYRKFNTDNSTYEYFKLHQMLFDPFRLYNNETDEIIKEIMHNNIEKYDQYFTKELKEHLFERDDELKPKKLGLDLVALNIQRGRDHGLAPYIYYRKACNLSVPKSFEDLTQYIDSNSITVFKNIYKTVNDIDLYTGAISEQQLSEGLVGPTLSCIIKKQFLNLRKFDRFWYETPEQPQAFTPEQLKEIKTTTLSSILCHNSDSMKYVPKWVMKTSLKEDIILCEDIPGPNLTFWKDF